MPGAGKSTIGVLLAKELALDFIDTDLLIQSREGFSLQHIIDSQGHVALRTIEEQVLLSLNPNRHIIATGGSAVYSEAAINHLKENGLVVFLDVNIDTLLSRINNFSSRGLAKRADQSFEDLYAERLPLYQKHADIVIDTSELDHDAVCKKLIESLLSIAD